MTVEEQNKRLIEIVKLFISNPAETEDGDPYCVFCGRTSRYTDERMVQHADWCPYIKARALLKEIEEDETQVEADRGD